MTEGYRGRRVVVVPLAPLPSEAALPGKQGQW